MFAKLGYSLLQIPGRLSERVSMSGHGSRMKKSCAFCERYMDHLHGKMKCFLKHMSANYRRSMIPAEQTIPDRFVNHFRGELSGSIEIESPDGSVYCVKVTKHMNKFVLQCGWEVFIDAHRIKDNDSLLFQHIENSRFKVLIFDSDGCEKVFSCSGIKITSNAQERAAEYVDISDSAHDYKKNISSARKRSANCQRHTPNYRRKVAKVAVAASSCEESGQDIECTADYESSFELDDSETNQEPDYVLSRMSTLSEEQEEKVEELIKEIRPGITVFVAIMKPSNVRSQQPSLVIGHDYAAAHFPHTNQIVTLQRPGKNKKWRPKFYIRKDRATHMFIGPWSDFVHDNHLREGDICIFQPVNNAGTKFTITVHVIRESKVDTSDENRNCPGAVSSSRGRMRTKVNDFKTASSSEGRSKAKVTLTTRVKEEAAHQGPLESDNSGGPSKELYILSGYAHLNSEQKKKVEETVRSIQSEVPIYVAIMNKSNVGTKSTCILVFGKRYATKYLPDGEQTLTLIRKGKSKVWKTKMLPRSGDSHGQMVTVGWRDFVHENHLEVEDICLFQQMDDTGLTMTVYIIRHG
ncbi:unnamed protein product [Urochloa decumbens]|uniref:TF-B3 domain-containing protein n=1 Tax=Urochloa decumbens TaxID=240449 RepID=A0ABC8X2Y4_9POAL